jgi:hypothetical protein
MARVRWRSAGYLAVFVVSALATYNSLQTLHGHARAGRHLEDEHVHHHHHQGVPAGSQISSRHHGARMDADVDPFHRTPRHREKGGSVAHIDAIRDEVDAAVKGGEFGLGASSFGADAGGESPKADVIDATPKEPKATKKKAGGNGKYHVLLTANDAVYVRWQSRIMYHQYKKIAADPALVGAMGGFTRILHSGKPDDLMDEIPTVIVDPLPKGIKDHGYVVLHRPYAFKQWLDTYARDIEEEFVLMTEPDHLYLRGMPLFATPKTAAAFPFFYIDPKNKDFEPIVQKYNEVKAPIDAFAPIGNSPVMIAVESLAKVVPKWHDLAVAMKQDPAADKAFGWVIEMWAYSIASAQVGVTYELHPEMMLQPPWDGSFKIKGKDAYIIHYTYGQDFARSGEATPGKIGEWHFDKRDFTGFPPKTPFPMPPKDAHEVIQKMMTIINDGITELPHWP